MVHPSEKVVLAKYKHNDEITNVIFCEVKTGGQEPSPEQAAYREIIKKLGAKYKLERIKSKRAMLLSQKQPGQKQIIEAIKRAGLPLNRLQLAILTGLSENTVKVYLKQMLKIKAVKKVWRGFYDIEKA